jgi:RNA polymerase sigma-70 factor, ECF subfamily
MNEEHPDNMLVARCLDGDVDAFGQLIDRYAKPVFNTVLHMVGNADDAREVCQQAYMKAFQHLSSYDPERKFFSWIYRVALNEAINHVKARHRHEPLSASLPYLRPDAAEELETAERSEHLRQAIASLDPNYRAVIILRHFVHLTYGEIAEALDVPEKTVKSRLFSARQLLRDALQSKGYAHH